MNVEIIPCLSDNFSYLILDKESDNVSIVDPSEFRACDNIIKKYKKLDFILNTHHHADHVDGNLELKKKYNSKILGFELDKDRIPGIDILLKENQKHKIGKLEFEVIFVPGHTKGHVAFFFFKEKVVFTGDTYDSKNTFLKAKEIEIRKKLSSNKPTIPTTLGQEIKTNIFFRCNDPEIRQTLGLKDSSEAKVFSKLRDLKDSF